MKRKTRKLNGLKKNNLRKRLGEVCVYCGCKHKFLLTIDHKHPTVRGGEDIDKNKQVCCFTCNQLKGALTHEEFKKYIKALNLLDDVNRLIFMQEIPKVKLNTSSYPITEEDIEYEIKLEQKRKDDIAWENQQDDKHDVSVADGEGGGK